MKAPAVLVRHRLGVALRLENRYVYYTFPFNYTVLDANPKFFSDIPFG